MGRSDDGDEAGEDPLDTWAAGRFRVGGSEGERGWRASGWRGGGTGRVHGWVASSSPWRQFGAASVVGGGCRFRSGPEGRKMPYASVVCGAGRRSVGRRSLGGTGHGGR